MKFNICYDFVSLIVLIIVTFKYYYHMRFPAFSNTLFGMLLILGDLNLIFDIIATIFISYINLVPLWVTYLINTSYYIIQLLLAASMLVFLIALFAGKTKVDRKYYVFSIIPVCIFIIIFLIGLALKKVFIITEAGEYLYGPLSSITYICVGFYLVITIVLLILKNKLLTKVEFASMTLLVVLTIVASALQFIYPTELFTGTAIAVSFLVMFFTIQDPQYYLDPVTNVFTGDAMKKLFDYCYARKKHLHLAVVKLHGLHNIHMLYGRKAGNASLTNLSDFLLSFYNAWSFRPGDAFFITSFKTAEELDEFARKFDKFKKQPQICDSAKINQRYTLLCVNDDNWFNSTKELMAVVENAFDDANISPIKQKITYLTEAKILRYRSNVAIENGIKTDIPTGDNFFMLYQPIFSTKRNKYVSLEALIRYKSDSLGIVKPNDFIPIVEGKGLAIQLDMMVIKKVFEDIKSGIFDNLGLDNININLSAATFSSTITINNIISIAKKYKIAPSIITFEITETASVLSETILYESANTLTKAGFGIALDDFGTGYTNIKRVANMPFSHIKMDKMFIQETPNIIKDLVTLFRGMGLHIIAEGVETLDQQKIIVNNGIDLIQGYYYSKAITKEEITSLINLTKTKKKSS